MTREFKPVEFHARAHAKMGMLHEENCRCHMSYQLTASFLAKKITEAVITFPQFLYIRYILRTFLIFLLKEARIIVRSVSTVLLEIDVESTFP